MPRAPDPGAKTNLRGVAAHAARWGGTGRAPSNPPALGLGFDAWGHSRETRELAGAVGEGATPCTDGRPSENTPPWLGLHQSSLPNAAKGYPPREPRENITEASSISLWHSSRYKTLILTIARKRYISVPSRSSCDPSRVRWHDAHRARQRCRAGCHVEVEHASIRSPSLPFHPIRQPGNGGDQRQSLRGVVEPHVTATAGSTPR